jgi:hypothetical protein
MRVPGNVRRREAFDGPSDLARFFRNGRLERYPRSREERIRVLDYIAQRFVRGREYTEHEINLSLQAIDNDHATLRRYLVDAGLLLRERGLYRKR